MIESLIFIGAFLGVIVSYKLWESQHNKREEKKFDAYVKYLNELSALHTKQLNKVNEQNTDRWCGVDYIMKQIENAPRP